MYFFLQVGRSVTGGGLISGHLPYGRPKHFDWAHGGANLFNLNSGQIFNKKNYKYLIKKIGNKYLIKKIGKNTHDDLGLVNPLGGSSSTWTVVKLEFGNDGF